ncbi:MAG: hypothetical protein HUU10_04540 [Bacteroidetes bacterium]|nr:hypothetical protein [Bacteroidota bacterium]
MALFSIPSLNYIVLQLVESNGITGETREDAIFLFQRLPTDISYTFSGRDVISKIGTRFYNDSYTKQPTQVSINGNMGMMALWTGTKYTTGPARVDAIEDIIVSRLDQVNSRYSKASQQKENQDNLTFYLNFYDFINKRYFQVYPASMMLGRSASRNPYSTVYQLSLIESGEIITAKQEDVMLTVLLSAQRLLADAAETANAAVDILIGNDAVRAISAFAMLTTEALVLINEMNEQASEISGNLIQNNPFSDFLASASVFSSETIR